MPYTIRVAPAAARAPSKLASFDRQRVALHIDGLADHPRPVGCKKLKGQRGLYRRVGAFRIIYRIQEKELLVLVVALADRRDIYQEIERLF